MGAIRKIMAAMLVGSALMAFQTDAYAQSRSGGSRSSSGSSRSTSVQRSSSNTSTRKSPAVSNGASSASRQTARPSGQTSRSSASRPSNPSGAVKPSNGSNRPSAAPSGSRPSVGNSGRPSNDNKPSAVGRPAGQPSSRPDNGFKPGNQNRPIGVTRPVSRPSDRPQNGPSHNRPSHNKPVVYPQKPGHVARPHKPSHHVGVKPPMRPAIYVYPAHVHRPYYGHRHPRPRPGVVIRPYYGTVIAHNIAAGMAWTAVRLAYFSSVARTYNKINDNYAYIAEQNAVIAQNNAIIAAQNQAIAQADALAQSAYDKANSLGLVQSYAAADMEYYYQNGVFYVLDSDGDYKVIVPPAGALVESLPSDRKTVKLRGEVYYQVDDTIYQAVNVDGNLYYEVLGQLYK